MDKKTVELPLTILQIWFLFKLFQNEDRWYTSKQLLKEVCKEGLGDFGMNSDPSIPLDALKDSGLLNHHSMGGKYSISNFGIIFTRQNFIDKITPTWSDINELEKTDLKAIQKFFNKIITMELPKKIIYIVDEFVKNKDLLAAVLTHLGMIE